MKRLKEQGITLIALVVTIVILLILAGITINITLGQNGIFSRTKNAVDIFQKDIENEMKIVEEIDDELKIANIQNLNKNDIGKLVDYNIDLDGKKDNYDWKIFYQGKKEDKKANKRIFIIASEFIPTTNNELTISTSEEKANMLTSTLEGNNKFCKCWSYDIRNRNIQKMQQNELFMANKCNLNDKKENANAKAASTLLNTDNWESFIYQDANGNKYGEYAIGSPTIEMWCAAWNEIIPEEGIDENNFVKINPIIENETDFGYKYSSIYSKNLEKIRINGTQESLTNEEIAKLSSLDKYKLFFPFTSQDVNVGDVTGKASGYWIASPGTAENGLINILLNGYLSGNGIADERLSIRPVVCLDPDVKLIWDEDNKVYHLSK